MEQLKMEQLKEIKKVIKEIEEKQGNAFRNFIIGLICFENGVELNTSDLETLNSIYNKFMRGSYGLLHDVFYDNEYELFNDKEKELLGL